MDIFPYLLDVLLTVVAAYWFVVNMRREPGSPTTGLFRYHEILEQNLPKPSTTNRPARYRPVPTVVAKIVSTSLPAAAGRRAPRAPRAGG